MAFFYRSYSTFIKFSYSLKINVTHVIVLLALAIGKILVRESVVRGILYDYK